jgi:5-methylcytosine-specific restriction protein A
MIDVGTLANHLSARFGHNISSEPNAGHAIRVEGIMPPNGFRIVVSSGWRSIDAVFMPDTFAAGLMRTLCSEDLQRRREFAALATAFASSGAACIIRVDEKTVEATALPAGDWAKLEISCTKLSDKSNEQGDVVEVAGACLALVLALLPVDGDAVEVSPLAQGLPEGAMTKVTVNRFERSPSNRAAAIALLGAYCNACGFDFAKVYGALGEGFIEVHHRIPVSKMGTGYVVTPATDLVPLCANCHQMVHRKDPPILVDEIRELLLERGTIPE